MPRGKARRKSAQISIRATPELLRSLEAEAERQRRSISDTAHILLTDALSARDHQAG